MNLLMSSPLCPYHGWSKSYYTTNFMEISVDINMLGHSGNQRSVIDEKINTLGNF